MKKGYLVFAFCIAIMMIFCSCSSHIPEAEEVEVSAIFVTPTPGPTLTPEPTPTATPTPEPTPIVLDVIARPSLEPDETTTLEALYTSARADSEAAAQLLNSLLLLGYTEEHPATKFAQTEVENTSTLENYYYDLLDIETWEARKAEWPVATEIWLYMKDLGWSDAICAGILGNIMTEVGGETLEIKYWRYDPTGYWYGICQWNRGNYAEVHGADLVGQLDFLRDTIKFEMDTFGSVYQTGFDYDSFLEMTDASQVARCFAMCYERCDKSTYYIRQQCAIEAYNYFVGE